MRRAVCMTLKRDITQGAGHSGVQRGWGQTGHSHHMDPDEQRPPGPSRVSRSDGSSGGSACGAGQGGWQRQEPCLAGRGDRRWLVLPPKVWKRPWRWSSLLRGRSAWRGDPRSAHRSVNVPPSTVLQHDAGTGKLLLLRGSEHPEATGRSPGAGQRDGSWNTGQTATPGQRGPSSAVPHAGSASPSQPSASAATHSRAAGQDQLSTSAWHRASSPAPHSRDDSVPGKMQSPTLSVLVPRGFGTRHRQPVPCTPALPGGSRHRTAELLSNPLVSSSAQWERPEPQGLPSTPGFIFKCWSEAPLFLLLTTAA